MFTRTIATALLASAIFASGAQAEETAAQFDLKAYKTDVRFHWKPAENKVTITFLSGCRSAHNAPPLLEEFFVYFDHDFRQFDIGGGYMVEVPKTPPVQSRPRIGSADCMGSRSRSVDVVNVRQVRYSVRRDGEEVRSIKFTDQEFNFVIRDERRN